jgi:phosphoribosylaminoimidazole-succinocarboxamide synthase
MKLVYRGKTKDVYELENGYYLMKFKDDVTGTDGVFDPGANRIGLTIDGVGRSNLRISKHFFEMLEKKGVPTHYIAADVENGTMTVKPAKSFGYGLEVICRYRAVGSFLRRYGRYVKEGYPLDAFVEVTLKDDEREDPPITEDALDMLGILSHEEYRVIKDLAKRISGMIREDLSKKGIELYDIKLEFGRLRSTEEIALIDEISSGNMRAYINGRRTEPMELERLILNS